MALLFYNEEENVLSVVTNLKEALERRGIDYQLVLVDNGSTDGTSKYIDDLVKGDDRLKKATVVENKGYGWGAIHGLNAGEGEWVGFMAGDGQVDPRDVVRLFQAAGSGADLVKVRRSYRQDGFVRGVISDVYVMIFCLIFNLPFYDVNATPRIFRRKWLDKFRLVSRDWFLDAEILVKAKNLGLSIKEVKIVFKRREGGASNVNLITIFEFLKNIAKLRFGRELKQWKKEIGLRL